MHIGKWRITVKDLVWFIVCLVLSLCFCVGLLIYDYSSASDVLSGASTAVSIVLSVIAILFTMIEGSNSSRMNQDTRSKLESINLKLEELTRKQNELKGMDSRIKAIVPTLASAAHKIEQTRNKDSKPIIEDEVKKEIELLMNYINEDIDE